jgi:hypothetical protein
MLRCKTCLWKPCVSTSQQGRTLKSLCPWRPGLFVAVPVTPAFVVHVMHAFLTHAYDKELELPTVGMHVAVCTCSWMS